MDYHIEADGVHASPIYTATRNFLNFNIDFIQKAQQKFNNANSLELIYKLRNVNPKVTGSYLVDLVTSGLLYNKLVIGIPREFFIPKNTSVVFEFIDSYHKDFKLKVFRKEGLPIYKVKSCSNSQT